MTMVDWLLTEQLVEIFRAARTKRPDLNAELVARSPHGEEDVLAGAGTAVRIQATDSGLYLITPRRLARVVDEAAYDMVVFADLIGYDWISPEMEDKVALKDFKGQDVIVYFYPRDDTPGCTKEAEGFRDLWRKLQLIQNFSHASTAMER